MSRYDELQKAAAYAAQDAIKFADEDEEIRALQQFHEEVDPETVLALIAENEELQGCEDVLRQLASHVGAGGYNAPEVDPETFARKIMDGINILNDPMAQLVIKKGEQIDQLRAEVAGLRTGYEAYEQVNAELKAENERLERNRDMWKGQVDRQCETIEGLRKALKAAEDAMWHADGNMDGEAADARDALAALGQGEQS